MNDFDRWIKGELEHHEASRPDAAWDRFASRLDTSDIQTSESNEFDAAMKDKLTRFEAGYQAHHWTILSRKLELQARQRTHMLQLKVLEGALLLLILLTLWNLHTSDAPILDAPQPLARIPSFEADNSDQLVIQPVQDEPVRPYPAILPVIPSGGSTADRSIDRGIAPLPVPDVSMLHMTRENRQGRIPQDRMPETGPASPADQSREPFAGIAEPIAALEPAHLESVLPVLGSTPMTHPTPATRHKVSMAIRGDLNYVMTPYDQLLVKRGYDQLASGYGGMIGYLMEGTTWSWRADLSYSRTYYLPKPYTEVFDGDLQRGYFAETLRDIELNMVSLSVQVQRTLKRKNRWHTYALLGGTGHLAFQANYDRKQSYIPGSDPNPGGTPEPLTQSKTSQKRYADGFFEGGNLAENSYLTLDLGIGLENQLNERVSLFVEPVYKHNPFQKSLGPNNDRINTLSLALGTRISL